MPLWPRKTPEASLHAVNPGSGVPRELALTKPEHSLGSANTNDLVLRHDTISREHASIRLRRGSWQIVDRTSSNGTFANGIRATDWTSLRQGDEIRLGGASFIFRVGKGAQSLSPKEPPTRRASHLRAIVILMAVSCVVGFAATQYFLYRSYHRAAMAQAAQAKP